MARKEVHRDVPPLARLFVGHSGFPDAANRSALVLAALRSAALRVRRSQPRPFYAMREVAAFFAVPLPTVARAYRALEDEGLLSRLRSSMTVVRPRRVRP
ncbi:MAG: GntR family transcriptional regulator, partial [Planctomycetes bacterium]|nr:GntR family transcriptional regulator [Planctomycetota bacterium]